MRWWVGVGLAFLFLVRVLGIFGAFFFFGIFGGWVFAAEGGFGLSAGASVV